MESSLKTRLVWLLAVVPVLCLIISVALWKHAQNETRDIQMVKRELKSDIESEMDKLHNELENLNKQKRAMQIQMESDKVQLQQHDQQLKAVTDSVSSVKREKRGSKTVGGAVYIHWGRIDCPSTAELVYAGVAGGSFSTHTGGAANMLCMTHKPVWATYGSNVNYYTYIYGVEYEVRSNDYPLGHGTAEKLDNHDVPCSVCRSTTRTSALMIPGTIQCESGWTTEYSGYIMAGYHGHNAATEYNCIDANPDAHESGSANENGYLLYRVKGICGSLPCPPYVDMREITCVVCTK